MDRNLTLAQIQKIKKDPAAYSYGSALTNKIEELIFRKKIKDFSVEDIRVLIGQDECLSITIPLAIEHLKENALAEGDYYPGDLLKMTLTSSPEYWKEHEDLRAEVEDIFIKNKQLIFDSDVTDEIKDKLRQAFDDFILM